MKKVLLTGCNTGIGMGLALELLSQGYYVIACCRKGEYKSLLQTKFSSVAKKDQYSMYSFDLSDEFEKNLEEIEEAEGIPDVIINNAGIYPRDGQGGQSSYEQIVQGLEVNLRAPMIICDYFKEKMRSKEWGRIVNVSSKMGSIADNRSGGSLAYRTTKVAINMYTVNLAHEMNDTEVKVFCVHPGWIQTRMGGSHAPDKVDEAVKRLMFTLSPEAQEYHGKFLVGSEILPW